MNQRLANIVKEDMLKKKAATKKVAENATQEEIDEIVNKYGYWYEAARMIADKRISKDHPSYKKVLDKAMEEYSRILIDEGVITPNSPEFDKAMQKAIEYPETAYFYLKDGKIKENDKFYDKAIESAISKGRFAWYIIEEGIVSENSPYYQKAKAKADKWGRQ